MQHPNWLELMTQQAQVDQILKTVSYTNQFGLTLSQKDAVLLAEERTRTLKQERRIEFGESILPKIIYAFCDSAYINQQDYLETLIELQEIFFLYQNEMQDALTDDELLTFMREQFEKVCFGDLDYLRDTCLNIFAQAVRAGYTGYQKTGGCGEFEAFDIVTRWDKELYLEALRELCWR